MLAGVLVAAAVWSGAAAGSAGAVPPEAAAASRADASLQEAEPLLFDDTVVRELSLTFSSDNWLALLGCERFGMPGAAPARREGVATLEMDGERLAEVGVRCKGNSSLSIAGTKKPLNITTDALVQGQRLWGFDIINLNNNWSDPSQLREAIILRMVREYAPVSRFGFARLTVQGRYVGLYTMVEQIDGRFASHWYPGDRGLRIKGDSPVRIAFDTSTLAWLGESLDPYKRNYEIKGAQAGEDAGYEALRELTRALDAPPSAGGLSDADFRDGIRAVLDVESALWYLALNNVLGNFDSYYAGKNFYLYLGNRDPRFDVITWDTGLGFGIFGLRGSNQRPGPGTGANTARVSPFAQETDAGRPLIRRLLAVPEFRADYAAHYRALLDEVFTVPWVEEVGVRYQQLIRDAVRDEAAAQGNVSGSFTYAQFESNLRQAIAGRQGAMGAPGILAFVADRRAYLAGLPELRAPDVRLAALDRAPAAPTAADAVLVEAAFSGSAAVREADLRYRVDGGLEHGVVMTLHPDGRWRAPLPAQAVGSVVSYVVRAAVGDGVADVVFFPSATLTKPERYTVQGVSLPQGEPGDVVINELMADNATTLADEHGEYDDWVELYNRGAEPVSLAGLFLSDKADDPWMFALPDVMLGAGERLLVWCDNDPDQGELHADFRLSKDGETVYLSTADEVLETVAFGPLDTDASFMRLPDGGPDWVICGRATPLEPNACDEPITPPATPLTPPPGTPEGTATAATPSPTETPGTPAATRTPMVDPTSTPEPAGRLWLPIARR